MWTKGKALILKKSNMFLNSTTEKTYIICEHIAER